MRAASLATAVPSWIVTAAIAAMFLGSTLVTPLYAIYRQEFGFSAATLTAIYATYAIGNLGALFWLGRLSDQMGRKPVSLGALAFIALSTLLFLFAAGTAWLFAGRLVSGFGIGLASGTTAAWLADFDQSRGKSKATLAASSANFGGLALGPLIGGALAQYAPSPLHLPYIFYLVLLAVMAILIARAHETVQEAQRVDGISLRPRLGVPRNLWLPFIAPAVTAFSTFALIGYYASLLPSIAREALHITNRAASGGVVFELFIVSTLAMIVSAKMPSRMAMLCGLSLLIPSLGLFVLAQFADSLALLLAATALAGTAAALGYRGSLQVVNEMAPKDRRAEVISSYYLMTFLGNSIPVIGVGIMTTLAGSMTASMAFACTIALFAIVALATGAKYSPRS